MASGPIPGPLVTADPHTMGQAREPDDRMTLHGEELRLETRSIDAGVVRVEKTVDTGPASSLIDRRVEEFDQLERIAPRDGDSGEIEQLPDGSISIPILEEQLVVTKRVVVRERVIVRKRVTNDPQLIEADLRSERVRVERIEPDEPGRTSHL